MQRLAVVVAVAGIVPDVPGLGEREIARVVDADTDVFRTADGAGLEEMFLELTADTQREGAAA